ncbi:MAG: hypothetical protein ACO3FI_09580 [Cyclobacteriaceae bacterium]
MKLIFIKNIFKKTVISLLRISCLLILIPAAFSQESELHKKLFDAGFEQIHFMDQDDTVRIFFEKRNFRFPLHSMQLAELKIHRLVKKPVVWIPLYHNKPMGTYRQGDYVFRPIRKEENKFFRQHNDLQQGYRFHFRLMPEYNANFGYYSNPYRNKTNLILDTRLYLLPGVSLHAGILFPIRNTLDNQEMNIRPGPIMLTWFGHNGNHFFNFTAGTFLSARYGFDFQYRFAPLNKNFSFGIESTMTGYYFWPSTGLYSEQLTELTLIGDLEWRLPGFPMISARASAGRFLFGDKGLRMDLIRQWGMVDISFFASVTTAGENAGFQFIIPLFPGKVLRTRKAEVRTSEEFPWEYGFNNEEIVASRYRLSVPRLSEVVRQYNDRLWTGRQSLKRPLSTH